ncbi:hypothetical protein AALP_AA7G185100 [Arabis alpina]|uniref:Auxin-responsive protein n=1 Tax=Arabis alpina TaxID=50452 RepID=A0A087GIY3_ARAAL|nr:hypothetical protein AALP_AA7G185100 [Arabis alpina]
MELDLDLSLSPHTGSSKLGFNFDLNKHCATEGVASCFDTEKLRFEAAFGLENIEDDCYVPKPRLFSLNGQPNEEDEDHLESDSSIVYDEEENSKVVGWPPIKSCMTKYHNYLHHSRNHPYRHHGRRNNISNPTATIGRVRPSSSSSSSSSTTSSRSSMYVKVKMDGVAIARKVDIKLFNSYESLTNSLITMFTQYDEGCDREDTNYRLTFQGKDGDWLLPGDVPWKIFVESVHRISIVRGRSCAYTRLLF